jgi:hypothetical protein
VNLGGVSLFYFLAIYVARAVVALAFGRFLLRSINQHREATMWYLAELALGLVVLAAFVSLPFFGLLFNAGALFMGLGTILNVWLVQFRRWRDAAPTPAPAWYEPSPVIARRALLRGNVQEEKVQEITDIDDEEDEMDDDTEQPSHPIQTIIPAPLPLPEENNPYPLAGAGMTNLPEGFDFSFFDTDTPQGESDE